MVQKDGVGAVPCHPHAPAHSLPDPELTVLALRLDLGDQIGRELLVLAHEGVGAGPYEPSETGGGKRKRNIGVEAPINTR